MTLVLSCLTRNFVIQASDRRCVFLGGGLRDDITNKAVAYCGHTAFAFTGLAEIGKDRADLWLASRLDEDFPMNESLRTIAQHAGDAFQDLPLSRAQKKHAFVGVGWAKMASTGQLRPMLSVISNFVNSDFGAAAEARDDFSVLVRMLQPREDYFLFDAGHPLSKDEKDLLRRRIRRATAKKRGPLPIAEIFVEQIRKVADRSRSRSVGRDVLLMAIPREMAGNPSLVMSPPDPGEVTFMYVPAAQEEPVWYGPTYKCQGITMTAFEFRTDRPPEPPKWLPKH